MNKIDKLTEILLDQTATEAERDDAAMDLGKYDDDHALNTLLLVASNLEDEPFIMNSCGESIAEIWVRKNQFDTNAYRKMHPLAKEEIERYIKIRKPGWISY